MAAVFGWLLKYVVTTVDSVWRGAYIFISKYIVMFSCSGVILLLSTMSLARLCIGWAREKSLGVLIILSFEVVMKNISKAFRFSGFALACFASANGSLADTVVP